MKFVTAAGLPKTAKEARKIIKNSFETKKHTPENTEV